MCLPLTPNTASTSRRINTVYSKMSWSDCGLGTQTLVLNFFYIKKDINLDILQIHYGGAQQIEETAMGFWGYLMTYLALGLVGISVLLIPKVLPDSQNNV